MRGRDSGSTRKLSGGKGGARRSPAASKKEVFGGAEASCIVGSPATRGFPFPLLKFVVFDVSDRFDSDAREVVESSKFMAWLRWNIFWREEDVTCGFGVKKSMIVSSGPLGV